MITSKVLKVVLLVMLVGSVGCGSESGVDPTRPPEATPKQMEKEKMKTGK